jgi:glycerol-3-phosphate dehydrogenase subunit B
LTAGWQAASRGLRTRVIAQGWGSTHWGAGCIDVLHSETGSSKSIVADLEILINEEPNHPYAIVGMEGLKNALSSFQKLCQDAMYPLHGSLETTWLLPTVLGAARPTCLAPETMIGGDLRTEIPMLLVGFDRYDDFWPQMTAANLGAQGIEAQTVIIDPPMLREYRRVETMRLAYLFDRADFRAQVVEALRPHLSRNVRVGFPGVLGMEHALAAKQDLEARLGVTVFEMPGLPPSVPGKRLHNLLVEAIRKAGGRVDNGMKVTTFSKDGNERVAAVWTEAAARPHQHPAESFILATGGVLGEGITSDPHGHVFETIFNLPVSNLPTNGIWAKEQFLATEGQPIFRAGIGVNEGFAPTDEAGNPIYENLFVIGNLLSGDFVRQRALEGVALASGFVVGKGVQ